MKTVEPDKHPDDPASDRRYRFLDLEIDTGRRRVMRDGTALSLPKLSYRLLVTLVEASPNVISHDDLVKRVWDGRVVSPETVTQRVKLLRQALDDDAADPRYVGVVRGEGYSLLPAVERLDLGPANRTLTVARELKLPPIAIVLLLVAVSAIVAFVVSTTIRPDPAGVAFSPKPNMVAVLPFVNVSSDADDRYQVDGISDDLRDQLNRMPDLLVVASRSSDKFESGSGESQRVAEQLGVAKLVEGQWKRSGNAVNVTVQVVDGSTGSIDWTSQYDGLIGNALDLHERISRDVIAQLLPGLDASTSRYDPATLSASAFDMMLLAEHYFDQVKQSSVVDLGVLRRVIELYRRATDIDPNSAVAYSRLGSALLYLGDAEAAEDPILRALTLDSTLSEAHDAFGLLLWMRFEPGAGEEHWKAVQQNPDNVDALSNYGKWLWHQQETQRVIPYFEEARRLDPESLQRYLDLGHLYGISNMRDKALEVASDIQSRFDDAEASMALARIHELTGDLDLGIAWALDAYEKQPDDPEKSWLVAELYARIGLFEEANRFEEVGTSFNVLYWARDYEQMIEVGEERALEQSNQVQIWYGLARAYAATGRHDQAIHVLRSQNLPHNALVDARRANGLEALVTLADSLRLVGETGLAFDYAEQARAHFSRLRETGSGDSWWPNLYDACTSIILGDRERALTALERVNRSDGLLWYPLLMDAPCFQELRGTAVYEDVVERYEDRLSALREKLPATLARFNRDKSREPEMIKD